VIVVYNVLPEEVSNTAPYEIPSRNGDSTRMVVKAASDLDILRIPPRLRLTATSLVSARLPWAEGGGSRTEGEMSPNSGLHFYTL